MKLLLILLISLNIYAQNQIFFLPHDGKKARKCIEKLIKKSQTSIDIAMYNIEDKKIAKLLSKAYNRGVDVTIFYDKKDVKLSHLNKMKVKKKLHTKIAIFDKNIVVFGSANWTKENFKENYEVIYITDDEKVVSKFNNFFETLY
ncbi:MAG: endonuclease [Epsilonproteobacteria bacterium]|nr:endonuclease [Campylobacterota bacterium]